MWLPLLVIFVVCAGISGPVFWAESQLLEIELEVNDGLVGHEAGFGRLEAAVRARQLDALHEGDLVRTVRLDREAGFEEAVVRLYDPRGCSGSAPGAAVAG